MGTLVRCSVFCKPQNQAHELENASSGDPPAWQCSQKNAIGPGKGPGSAPIRLTSAMCPPFWGHSYLWTPEGSLKQEFPDLQTSLQPAAGRGHSSRTGSPSVTQLLGRHLQGWGTADPSGPCTATCRMK